MNGKYRMFARPGAGLLAVLLAGLPAHYAGAAEGLSPVQLAQSAIEARAEPTSAEADLKEYLRSVNEEIRTDLESSFKQRPAPRLQIAAAVESSTRS